MNDYLNDLPVKRDLEEVAHPDHYIVFCAGDNDQTVLGWKTTVSTADPQLTSTRHYKLNKMAD